MERLLIFGGTTEGREQALAARERGNEVLVCVTSDYARELLPRDLPCHVGAMDETRMAELMADFAPDRVLDATHPFAVRATRTIATCCERLKLPLVRVERPAEEAAWRDACQWVSDAHQAARMLNLTRGNVLLTTGSHTLHLYAQAVDPQRLYARVLPTQEALSLCAQAGLPGSHIVAMQGPFTEALNAAIYDQLDIRTLVTKDSGAAGGVAEKVIPALARDIHVIIIGRPRAEE